MREDPPSGINSAIHFANCINSGFMQKFFLDIEG